MRPKSDLFIVIDIWTHRETLRPQIVEIKAGCRDIGARSFHFLLFGYYFFMCDVLDEKF